MYLLSYHPSQCGYSLRQLFPLTLSLDIFLCFYFDIYMATSHTYFFYFDDCAVNQLLTMSYPATKIMQKNCVFVYKSKVLCKHFVNDRIERAKKGRKKCLFLFFTDYPLDAFYGWLNGIIK